MILSIPPTKKFPIDFKKADRLSGGIDIFSPPIYGEK
jgi:hypothetical protein